MKISVVTNAFNQGRYLAAAVESVLAQEGEIEYWLVDPGSSDDTGDVIARLEQRHPGRFGVITDKDEGPADGLNKAFARCSGDIFVYLNGDDVFLPGCFAAARQCFASNPGAGAIIGNGYIIDGEGRYVRRVISTRFTADRFVRGTALALQQSTFYNPDAFRAVGGFNAGNWASWDAELLLDMDRAGFPLVNAAGYWSLFRIHSESITGSQKWVDRSRSNQERMFHKAMGRERTTADAKLARRSQLIHRLAHPTQTFLRLQDAIAPRRHLFVEALPPAWLMGSDDAAFPRNGSEGG